MRILFLLLVNSLFAAQAGAAEAQRTIDIYVTPYYVSAETAGGSPDISVASAYDALLTEGSAASLKKVAEHLKAHHSAITPMTMMVLAIRFYDAGLRDESVFWFYVATYRFWTATRVLDFSSPALREVAYAMHAFYTLAGPYINGYAFCDVDRLIAIDSNAVAWVTTHPYAAVFVESLPALPGDRRTKLESANAELQQRTRVREAKLKDPQFLKKLTKMRKANNADVKYCWK